MGKVDVVEVFSPTRLRARLVLYMLEHWTYGVAQLSMWFYTTVQGAQRQSDRHDHLDAAGRQVDKGRPATTFSTIQAGGAGDEAAEHDSGL